MISTIFRKFKTLLRISFLDENTKRYIQLNKEIFNVKVNDNKKLDGIILVDFFDWNPFIFFWSILSNFLKKRENLQIKFFYFPIYHRYTENFFFLKRRLIKIYDSFGCTLGITSLNKFLTSSQKKNYERLFKTINSKDDLLKYKFKSILIGDLIYDTVLRKFRLPTFDIDDPRVKKSFFEAHLIYDLVENYFEKNYVKYLIVSDTVYNSFGVITRLAERKKIKILHLATLGKGCTNLRLKNYNPKIKSTRNPYYNYKKIFSNLNDEEKQNGLLLGEELVKKRVVGDVNSGIEYLSKSPFAKSSNPNSNLFPKESFQVLLALHNFFDNPHKYRSFYYDDYMDWALNTLDILSKKNINIYLKWHPISFKYSSDVHAKKIISNKIKNLKNVKIIFDELNYTDLINNGLSWAITAHGTVANELPFSGVKVMNCGDNPHINYNFSITPKSKEEYESNLNNIKNLDYQIDRKEIYEFYYMNYVYFNQKNFSHKISDKDYVHEKETRLDVDLNNSSEFFKFASSKILNEKIVSKTENYINEFLVKGDLG